MPKTVTFDEIHLVLLVPAHLNPQHSLTIRRVTRHKSFDRKLSQAIQQVLDSYPAMKPVSFTLTR